MQECRVCGLLFLGGGACPSCGSQVSMDVSVDDIKMDDETIPGLDEIADAIGDASDYEEKSEVLPFGLGAKAEVIKSSLPFGVGSFTSEVNEVAIPFSDADHESDIDQHVTVELKIDEEESGKEFDDDYQEKQPQNEIQAQMPKEIISQSNDVSPSANPSDLIHDDTPIEVAKESKGETYDESQIPIRFAAHPITEIGNIPVDAEPLVADFVLAEGVPDMWKIDAAEVDMEAIYSQEDQIVEVSFDNELYSSDVQVTFDDFHHSPAEDSMASDDDSPELHPAKALPVESSGQPEITSMINAAFEHMASSSWMQAAQILSTASSNRQNDPAILNNLGLALLQSALEMDSKNDPMSSSQYEAAIMALRQGAKVDGNNNTILLNLSHALLVSGRAEKALRIINVLRTRENNNLEIENVLGACLIQLGRDEDAESVLRPFESDSIVAANLDLI